MQEMAIRPRTGLDESTAEIFADGGLKPGLRINTMNSAYCLSIVTKIWFGNLRALSPAYDDELLGRCSVLQMEVQESIIGNSYISPTTLGSNDPAVGRLLPLFPSAKPAHIAVRVGLPERANGAVEKTTIMFKGHDTAIFLLNYPLFGGEAVQLRSSTGVLATPATVVAQMPNGQGSAVAVRFLDQVPKWLLKA